MPKRPDDAQEVAAPTPAQKAVAQIKPTSKGGLNQITTTTLDEKTGQVSYDISITKNLGNYESLKISASATLPIGADKAMLDRMDETMVVVRERIMARLTEDLAEVTASL